MNSPTAALRVGGIVFAIFAIGHLVRLIQHAEVHVGSLQIPMWVSVVGAIVALILSIWFLKLSAKR